MDDDEISRLSREAADRLIQSGRFNALMDRFAKELRNEITKELVTILSERLGDLGGDEEWFQALVNMVNDTR